ncbi:myristoyl transferase, partial [Butyricicoccus sp. 1XD8-22]
MKELKKLSLLLFGLALLVVLAACGGSGSSSEPAGEGTGTSGSETPSETTEEPVEMKDVKLVLNWFAKAQHGGVYAAQENGLFEEAGLNVTVEPGGPQVSSINMVASGN